MEKSEETPIMLTVAQVAKTLQMSRQSIYNLIEHKELPSFKIGNCRRIRTADLATYLQKNQIS